MPLVDPRTNYCSLSIRDARMSDTGISFYVEIGNHVKCDYNDMMLTLQVTGTAGAQERIQGHGTLS